MNNFQQVRKNLLEMLEGIDEKLNDVPANHEVTVDIPATNTTEAMVLAEINSIKQALAQVDSGTFGICLSCGQSINREHLKTKPLSSYCVSCTKRNSSISS